MIALWISWFCLLVSIIIAYVLLMDQESWRAHFMEFDDTGQRIQKYWHKSRIILTIIQGLLGLSAFALLMHFVLPAADSAPKTPANQSVVNNSVLNMTR